MHAESKRNPVIVPAFRPETEYRIVIQFPGHEPIAYKTKEANRDSLAASLEFFRLSGATIVSIEPTNHS